MNKLSNITFVLLVFTLASIVHGSAFQRLKRSAAIATKLAKPRATHGASVRNMCNEAGKSQWMPGRGFTGGQYRIAKNVGLGITGAAVGGTVSYYTVYGLMPEALCSKHKKILSKEESRRLYVLYRDEGRLTEPEDILEKDRCFARENARVIGATAAVISSVAGGPVGIASFAASVAAVGCARSVKITFDGYKATQVKEAK